MTAARSIKGQAGARATTTLTAVLACSVANFVGANCCWPSFAESHFTVVQPAVTASPQPIAAQPPTGMYITEATVAIIIAIAIVGAVIIVALRKRP